MKSDSHRGGNYSGISIFLPDEVWWGDYYEDWQYVPNPRDADRDGDGISDADEWAHLLNPRSKDTDGDRMPDNYEVEYGRYRGGWQDPKIHNERYALIIVGGGYQDPEDVDYDTYLPAFWNDGKAMYNKLVKDYRYKKENVYLMSSRWYSKYDGSWAWRGHNPSTDSIVDGEVMWNSPDKYDIKDALNDIASKITVHDLLMIVIITHGGSGGFVVRADVSYNEAKSNPSSQSGWMSYSDLGNYINTKFGNNNNRKYAVMIIVNQACFSGTMMDSLKGTNRILISAADSGHKAWTETAWAGQTPYEHWAFLYQGRAWPWETHDGFILGMGQLDNPESIEHAYEKGDYAAAHNHCEYSHPQLIWMNIVPARAYL